ncbi:enoyl-CoA hydratase/isomerase [Pseudogulbenkiania sp. NH8B]|uniref:enoyl-CoA hydratase-related protein n=1 Tax=Pseudogulbenkiania sp. (strain NH8B) TaxID=748280 RepID=UPI0002279AB0|nr:enoyl-CoA hydratase-related protein [Pseudogulbenkiania sp. NH8B]BAK76362.1 enoyl-CoA hydratase/isomerase [Pseudogulbenkiania sp. NH8B]
MLHPILHSVDDQGIATLRLNRAELHNALDDTMIVQLTSALETLTADARVRAIVLAAEGISFCAGHDSAWMQRMAGFGQEEIKQHARLLATLLGTLDNCPKPTIARVQGSAFGIGAGLLACCDVAIGASEALFCFSDVKLGMIPASVAPYVMRAIGERATRRYFITAERFNAGKAKRLGLIHLVVEHEELDMAVAQMCRQVLLNGPQAMAEAKQLVRELGGRAITADTIETTIARIAQIHASTEGQEGVAAFIEQRAPSWIHRE